MSRQATPDEIMETNALLTYTCDSCNKTIQGTMFGGGDNSLNLTLHGGYAEFVDNAGASEGERTFILCHKCGHKLIDSMFSNWELSKWHTRTSDKFCNGWQADKLIDENYEGDYW